MKRLVSVISGCVFLAGASCGAQAQGVDQGWMNYQNPYTAEQTDISNPHRTGEEIVAWGAAAAASLMTFHRANDFRATVTESRKYFAATGWKEYVTYLKESGMAKHGADGIINISAVADGEPVVLASGAQGGAYHWKLRAPIILSMTEKGPDGKERLLSNQKVNVVMLVVRVTPDVVAGTGNVDSILINQWQVTGG